MEKNQKILLALIISIFIVALGMCTYLIISSKTNKLSDGEKLKKEYESLNDQEYLNSNNKYEKYLNVSISKDNLYVYKTQSEILDILENKTGIILFCSSKNSYCRNLINPLNDAAKETKQKEISYIDIDNIRNTYEIFDGQPQILVNGTSEYSEMLNILDSYLDYYKLYDNDKNEYNTGEKIINTSTVVAVKEGKIVGFHEYTVDGQVSNEKLSDKSYKELKKIYTNMIKKIK